MKWLKQLVCKIGWHGPLDMGAFDGASFHAKCKWCGYVGMLDSNGDLF